VGKSISNFFQRSPQSESSSEIDPYYQFNEESPTKSPKKEKAVETLLEISNESPKKENEQATKTILSDNSESSEMSESTDEASSITHDRTKQPKKKRLI
jgi:hypothetical protein